VKDLTVFGMAALSIIMSLSLGAAIAEVIDDGANATRLLTNMTNVTLLKNETGPKMNSSPGNGSFGNLIINVSEMNFGILPLKKPVFRIDEGYSPAEDAYLMGQSSINGATLLRAVEGTPHGYVTYHN
jgi:hypothetical protein